MATLTQTAYYSRQTIKYGSIAIVALLIFRSAFISFQSYWKSAHPSPPPKPTVAYGKLPKLNFPARPNLPPITLKPETISGSLPKLSDQAKVFFMPQPSDNLLARDRAKAWAKQLGFLKEPEKNETNVLIYTTETSPKTTLEINILTRNFKLLYDWKNDLEMPYTGTLLGEAQAIAMAKSFLQQKQVENSNDLLLGPAEAIYLQYENGNLVKPISLSEANFVRVNLFRNNIDDLRILPPNPKEANVSFLISPTESKKGIIEVKFINFSISLENYATYPLKDVNTAWTQLASGKGFIANLGNNPDGKVIVRNAYLAYFDNEEPQSFLQPIIVFEGDNDFYAYVPAVSDSWSE